MNILNRVAMSDSYKYSQARQYPKETVSMFDYAEARSSKEYPSTVFVGLQHVLMKYFCTPIEQWEVDEMALDMKDHGVYFDKAGWDYIVQDLKGMLPVKIRAVREGLLIPVGNALFTIESTDNRVFWIVSWLETVLMTSYYMSNVATRSYYVRKQLEETAEETQDDPFVLYQFHNFGARGSVNPEAAQASGIAHLAAGFLGSDNISAFRGVLNYYPSDDVTMRTRIMHSINATEHSSTTSWTRENELDMIMSHLEDNKGEVLAAAVCDSYDYIKCITAICKKDGEFQKKIQSDEYPTFVMRPDSGNHEDVINQTLDVMEAEEVPFTTNQKGFKVFTKMRIIWGDGTNGRSIKVMQKVLKMRGYSTLNLAFGSGGWLVQQHNRDTQGWAIKCSNINLDMGSPVDTGAGATIWEESIIERDVYKDPITAPNKKSKKGRLTLWFNHASGTYFTDSVHYKSNDAPVTDMLNTVYLNGEMTKIWSLDDLRNANA